MLEKTEFVSQHPERIPVVRKQPGFISSSSSFLMMIAGILGIVLAAAPIFIGKMGDSWVSGSYFRVNLLCLGLMLLLHGFYGLRRNRTLSGCAPETFEGKLKKLQLFSWGLPVIAMLICYFPFLIQGYSTAVGQPEVGYVAASYLILSAVLIEALIHIIPWSPKPCRKFFSTLILVYQAALAAVLLSKGVLLPEGRGIGRFFYHFPLMGILLTTGVLALITNAASFSSVAYRRQVGPYFFMDGRPKMQEGELLEIPKANKHGCRKHRNWVIPVMTILGVPLIFMTTVYLCEEAESGFHMARFMNFLFASLLLCLAMVPFARFKLTEYTYLGLTDLLLTMFWVALFVNVMATHPVFSWKTYFLMFAFLVTVFWEIECPGALLRGLLGIVVDLAITSDMDDYDYQIYEEEMEELRKEQDQAMDDLQRHKAEEDYRRRFHESK